jgi:nucleotide-binding universal stress UspA family protein
LIRHLPDAKVTLFHVSTSVGRVNLLKSKFNVKSLLEEDAHQAIIRTEYKFKQEGLPFDLDVALGDPAEEIVRKAKREAYDLIIIGSRGLTVFKELLLGSVSQRVVHEVKCPVMIVK